MDDFGLIFDLNKGVISQYIRKISTPKIDTIIKICDKYQITIDDFVRKDLSVKEYSSNNSSSYVYEPPEGYGIIHLKYVETLENSLRDKDKLIENYEQQLGIREKNSSA